MVLYQCALHIQLGSVDQSQEPPPVVGSPKDREGEDRASQGKAIDRHRVLTGILVHFFQILDDYYGQFNQITIFERPVALPRGVGDVAR